MPDYDSLKNHQNELIRKALKGSFFLASEDADGISTLTTYSAAAAAQLNGTIAAITIVTTGNLVLKIDGGANVTTALVATDTAAGAVTKINTAIGAAGTASLVSGILRIVSATTGASSSVVVVSGTGTVLSNLSLTAAQSATGSAAGISLTALPSLWDDLGLLGADGVSASNDISNSEVTSWGYTTPSRSDVTTDSTTMQIMCQETKLLTIGLYTDTDLTELVPTANTGEVAISKLARPKSKYYRGLLIAVDDSDDGEIFIGRYFPRLKVTGKSEQKFGGGDEPISWGVTVQTFVDESLGYSETRLFGGPGWLAKLDAMGFLPAA